MAANTGTFLHLVEPLGFRINDRALRRAGLDYGEFADVRVHENWSACRAALADKRLFALTTKGAVRHDEPAFAPDDVFVFGPETRGLPAEILDPLPPERRLRLPMLADSRSLNLSNAVAVVIYEAWRQNGFTGAA